MSERNRYSIVKGVPPHRVNSLVAEASKIFPGPPPKNSKWGDWTSVRGSTTFPAVACNDTLVITDDAWQLAQEISRIVDSPHLELRVEEGDHWDFTLFRRGEVVVDFSTRVAYFESDPTAPRPWKQGDARVFAECWGVAMEQVSPYLIDWDCLPAPRLVNPADRSPTGDWRQVFDFMRVIGVEDPYDHPDHFEIAVPCWQGAYVRQSWWRRAVRQVSVWIKGTYPDVPRLTRQQRQEWGKRLSAIRIVRIDADNLGEDG